MRKYQMSLVVFIAFLILLTGFKKNNYANTHTDVAPVTISIGNAGVVEGNGGQRSVEVMVIISQNITSAITIAYSTRNGTASAGSDYVAANGAVNFAPGEWVKKITVLVNGDLVIEGHETFEILLGNGPGATPVDSVGTVTIVNDDFKGGNDLNSVYEVRLTHTGAIRLYGSRTDCPTPLDYGENVILAGLLEGRENVNSDDDIMYTGILYLEIVTDVCSVKPGDPDKFCKMSVAASCAVKTELEIYYDQRGGYVNFEYHSGEISKMVFGIRESCDAKQMNEEKDLIPDKSIVSIFNGRDLPMLKNRTLRIGRYVETDGENKTVVEVIRKIR